MPRRSNGYNLFIDDERLPPRDGRFWITARSKDQVNQTFMYMGMPDYISFDHDLGENQPTGLDIAKMLCEWDMDARHVDNRFPDDFQFYVHSQNPVGKQNIENYLNSYLKQRKPNG